MPAMGFAFDILLETGGTQQVGNKKPEYESPVNFTIPCVNPVPWDRYYDDGGIREQCRYKEID